MNSTVELVGEYSGGVPYQSQENTMKKYGKQRKLQKKEEAQKRNERRKTRSAKEQINILDARFGENQGAKKERYKLVNEIKKAFANATKKSSKKRPKPKRDH